MSNDHSSRSSSVPSEPNDNVRFVPPAKPRAPAPSVPQIQYTAPKVQHEQKNIRDTSQARIISPEEMNQQEKDRKLREKQAKKLARLKEQLHKLEAEEQGMPEEKPVKQVCLLRYQFQRLDGSLGPINSVAPGDDPDRVVTELKSAMLENFNMANCRVLSGTWLVVHFGEKSEIFWYSSEKTAQNAGEKATDRGALCVKIDPILRKEDLLKAMPRPTRAPLAKKKMIQIRQDNYNRGTSWQKVGQTRVTFSGG